jgi:hypothetical protein
MLDKALGYLNQGWVGSVLGIAGIVIGAIISYWLFKRSEQLAAPAVVQNGFRLVGGDQRKVDGLEVKATFHGREVSRLARSEVRFWNAGNKTLEGDSMAPREPLRLELAAGEEFLSARVVHCTRTVNGFHVEIHKDLPNTLLVNFDFLDGGDGAVIESYHNGQLSRPYIKGVFKGIPQGIVEKYGPEPWGPGMRQAAANKVLKFGIFALVVATILKLNDYTGWWPFGLAIVPLLLSLTDRAPYPDSLQLNAGPEKKGHATRDGSQ